MVFQEIVTQLPRERVCKKVVLKSKKSATFPGDSNDDMIFIGKFQVRLKRLHCKCFSENSVKLEKEAGTLRNTTLEFCFLEMIIKSNSITKFLSMQVIFSARSNFLP